MDTRSKELSLRVYYGFSCCADTCATVQMTKRTWYSLDNQFLKLAGISKRQDVLGTGSQFEGTSLLVTKFPEPSGSDTDSMHVDTQFHAYPIGYNGDYDFTKYCLQMKTNEHTRQGYCLVDVIGEKNIHLNSYFKNIQHDLSEHARMQMSDGINNNNVCNKGEITGPAFTFVNSFNSAYPLSNDTVICFESKQ